MSPDIHQVALFHDQANSALDCFQDLDEYLKVYRAVQNGQYDDAGTRCIPNSPWDAEASVYAFLKSCLPGGRRYPMGLSNE